MAKARGFSLLELLIVVAIILIIATIAIPSLLRSRQAANETGAVANMKTLNTAEVSYSSAEGGAFGTLSQLVGAGLIDSRFLGTIGGFNFTANVTPDGTGFTAYAVALSANTGRYDYYAATDFIIRYSTDSTRSPAGMAGQPVQ